MSYSISPTPAASPQSGFLLQTLTGDGGGAVSPNSSSNINLLGSGGISVTGIPSTNTVSIGFSGGATGLTWNYNSLTQTMIANNGYIVTSGSPTLTLPVTSILGDVIEILLDGGSSFSIAQGVGQQIRAGTTSSTVGAGGSVISLSQGAALRLICTVANFTWQADIITGSYLVI